MREITGYTNGGNSGGSPATTHVYIFDSWEGFAIVATYWGYNKTVPQRRLEATARLDALNEEHRRWLHSGRWPSKVPPMQAATVGEDAQATKGKGSR
jgi:hypothetical protein